MADAINRQAAIDALEEPRKVSDTWTDEYAVGERTQWEKDVKALNSLPSAQPNIKDAISAIRQFLDDGKFITTCKFITKDGVCLMTDWGYFEEGLDELERYAEKGAKNERI